MQQNNSKPIPTLLLAREVAQLFGVKTTTITRWAKDNKIPWIKTIGGHRRYPSKPILQLLESRQFNADVECAD